MNKVIVSTTIYPVSQGSLEEFDNMPGWTLIVAGDTKTPSDFKLKNGIYLSYEDQEKMDKTLSDLIGPCSIQRRNFGLLMAHKIGATLVSSVDSDNIPHNNWGKDVPIGETLTIHEYQTDLPAFDPIGEGTEYRQLWHRGFPLQLLRQRKRRELKLVKKKIDVISSFWQGEFDVDSVCRFEHDTFGIFNKSSFPFTSNSWGPFNSQNTFISKDVLPHYFMANATGRYDDVVNSYYVQSLGFNVAYFEPTVTQERNPHDFTKDMVKEFWGYENCYKLIKDLHESPKTYFDNIPERSAAAFRRYQSHFS